MPRKLPTAPAPLDAYRAKRSPDRTPEPFGGAPDRPRLFVVQKHAARQLHYDFRLELGGVLVSWAVPKGPSFDPKDKRFAAHVEDHPVEYADFEGIIPPGNYGAGEVIVWDKGRWNPIEDPVAGLEKGKLLFELFGYKLHGVWTLVRTKRNPKDWLLIKHQDAWAGPGRSVPETSVLSGLTVEELRGHAAEGLASKIDADLAAAGASKRAVDAGTAPLMLATVGEKPFSKPGWLFELKIDGFRILAERSAAGARLIYRRGMDASAIYPEITRAVRALPFHGLLLDGEVTVLDPEGRPSFELLQQRAMLSRPADIERKVVELPATLHVFDLLACDGFDLRPLPLSVRKGFLRRVLPALGPLRYLDHVEEKGAELFAEVQARRLEGVVGKRADAPYRAGRSSDWIKWRTEQTGDFVVVGYTEPKSSRIGLGALHLAEYEGEKLVYRGRVGTGLGDDLLAETRQRLEPTQLPAPPCEGELPKGREHHWVRPTLVCEVRFKEQTSQGLLRQPSFLRFRTDKAVEDCRTQPVSSSVRPERSRGALRQAQGRLLDVIRSSTQPALSPAEGLGPNGTPGDGVSRTVLFTNRSKLFWPKQGSTSGYTKGDLIDYYRAIAPWLLPYLRDRPVVLTRFPDGIDGKSFYQKDAPGYVPSWIRTERIWSEHTAREIRYFVCDDLETLLYLANLGTIPLHVWASRASSKDRPDWTIVDLDPKGAPFTDVVTLARAVHALCEAIALPCFLKTSGATGLHVLIPLGGQCSYQESRSLAEILARVVEKEHAGISTTVRSLAERGGKVYLDYLQNVQGQTIAAPFSARPVPAASVSMPLRWKEATARLDPKAFNLTTAPARMKRLGDDPMLPVLSLKPDLAGALAALQKRLRP